jgi:hypothetical protein
VEGIQLTTRLGDVVNPLLVSSLFLPHSTPATTVVSGPAARTGADSERTRQRRTLAALPPNVLDGLLKQKRRLTSNRAVVESSQARVPPPSVHTAPRRNVRT